MSISSAPASTAMRVSSSFTCVEDIPLGKAVATDAMWIPVPFSAFRATPTMVG